MSSTATKPNALSELARFEAEEAEAKEQTDHLSHELVSRQRRLLRYLDTPGAVDELRRLQLREPDQFDADGNPRKGTQAAALAKEIDELNADIQKLTPQLDQARRRQEAARLAREEFMRENVHAIVEAYRPEAEARRAAIQERAAEDAAFYAEQVGFIQKLQATIGTVPTQRDVRVPGLQTAADLMRNAERLDFPLPFPELRNV